MKTLSTFLLLFIAAPGLWAQIPPPPAGAPAPAPAPGLSRAALNGLPPVLPAPGATMTPAIETSAAPVPAPEVPGIDINFPGVDVNQVLDIYADLIGRFLLRAPGLPQVSITFNTHDKKLTKTQAIEALQALLAMNNIAVINIGTDFVKAVPLDQAGGYAQNIDTNSTPGSLPDIGNIVTHIVQLKYVKPSEMIPVLQPFAKLPNSLIAIDANGTLVMRDLAENVQRMLQMIDKIDVNVPAVYISEVIPIRYAQAADIASALTSLGGHGGATVAIGGNTAPAPINGMRREGSMGVSGVGGYPGSPGANPIGGPSGLGARPGAVPSPNGTPGGPSTVQQRLLSIINRATPSAGGGGEEPIQLFGQAEIIADSRANSLLIYATRPDMDAITNIIAKLDVLLPQVLIESAIIDYELGPNTLDYGISAAQNPKVLASNPQIQGAGGVNNGQSFFNFLNNSFNTTNATSLFGSGLGSGFSYFGNIGQRWDLALAAAQADSRASIVQKPRIQTSQAKPAQFFVGNTVPYITGYGNYGYGNQSTYSQLSVGVELDVTPYINPDGLVVMDINQEIDDLGAKDLIDGNPVYETTKRTLSSEVAVRDRDTVMLGGFIRSNKSTSRTGVPLLMDIPLLGNLFTKRDDSKSRTELVVLMRPTVLKTPELAAAQAITEEQQLPGVSKVMKDDEAAERKTAEAEQKRELRQQGVQSPGGASNVAPQYREDGLFTPVPPVLPPVQSDTNTVTPATP
jgi:general secretion pathway protein D